MKVYQLIKHPEFDSYTVVSTHDLNYPEYMFLKYPIIQEGTKKECEDFLQEIISEQLQILD